MRGVPPEHVQRDRLPWLKATSQCSIRTCSPPCTSGLVLADVAGGEHPGRRTAQARVAQHAAALSDLEAGTLGEADVRRDAGADHDGLCRQLQAGAGDDLGDPLLALEALELVAAVDRHAALLRAGPG